MTLRIYGIEASRAARVLWAAEELGLDFEHIPYHYQGAEIREPAFLALSPYGKIPVIEDGGFALSESLAINLYLTKKHGKLYPTTLEDEARAWSWSLFAATAIEPLVMQALIARVLGPPQSRNEAEAVDAEAKLRRPFGALDTVLAGRPYLIGDEFTIADLNVASVLTLSIPARIDLSGFPALARWFKSCVARPSLKASRARAKTNEGKPAE